MGVVNLRARLSRTRKRMAKGIIKLIDAAARSDAKLYARPGTFVPIFDSNDAPLTAAITLVKDRLSVVIDPGS